jgi:hypothetical protein
VRACQGEGVRAWESDRVGAWGRERVEKRTRATTLARPHASTLPLSHLPTRPRSHDTTLRCSHTRARRLAERCGVWLIVAACVSTTTSAAAFQQTVGGHPVDLDATLSVREVFEENRSTTHDRTLELLRVRAAITLTDWLRFDSSTMGFNGGPTMKADRSGVYNLSDTFQDISPGAEFEEAYFDVRLPSVDLRLGKQKVAWGKLDRDQPTDLINTQNYSDLFLQDETERKIGVPAVQASYYPPPAPWLPAESRLTAVWVPQYVPYRFPLAGCDAHGGCNIERWFPPAAVPPLTITIPPNIGGLGTPAFTAPLGFQVRNVPSPSWRFENNEIGLRYSGLIHDADAALSYFHGFDPQPAFNLTATAFGNPAHLNDLSAITTLSPAFRHIDAGGGDVAYAFDRLTVRGEGAFISGRPFPRNLQTLVSDPNMIADSIVTALRQLGSGAASANVALPQAYAVHDAVEWGLGADYTYAGYLLLLQVNQTDVLHNHVELLIKDVDTRFVANLRKSFFAETLQAQLVAVQAVESDYTILRPRLRYQLTDAVAAEAGYLFIAGRSQSLGGQYKRNDQGWVRVEYRI